MSRVDLSIDTNLIEGSDPAQVSKYLTFELDSTEYAIEILKVVEILKVTEITTIPMWPGFAKGTLDLRGRVIPVVDLRQKFGLPATEATKQTCTIVVELGEDQIGIEVEAVNEVREIKQENISAPPSIGGTVDSDFILGMGKTDDSTIVLLNLEKILLGTEMEMLLEDATETLQPA